MSLHFETIRWQNFLSTGNQFTEIKLNKSSSTLIVGENGAGKSTLLDAIMFVLYGRPYRNINKPLLVNSITNKNCLVEIEFISKRKKYLVRRGIKPAVFDIYCDGKLVDQNSTTKEYQDHFEKNVLGMNHKSFTQIVVIGSANFTPFMQLRAHERRAVIEDLLDIEIFTSMYNVLRDKMAFNKGAITDCKYQMDLLKQKIEMTHKHMNEIISIKNSDRENKLQFIEELKTQNQEKQNQISVISETISGLQSLITDKKSTQDKITKLDSFHYKFKHKIDNINKDILFFKNNDNCPTCHQSIDESFKLKNIDDKQKGINDLEDAIQKLNSEYETVTKRLEEINDISYQVGDLNQKIMMINTEIMSNNVQMKQITQKLEQEVNDDIDFDEIEKYKKELKKKIDEYETLMNEKEKFEISLSLLKDTGIKTRIIKQYIPIINKLMNKYLATLDFFVQFQLDENFNEKILSRFRDEFSYDSFSEGEKMRVDMALLFTWRAIAKLRNSTTTNLLILDEVFDSSLDTNGTDEFMKMISQLGSETNIFVISHKGDTLYDKFHSNIRFEKVKNFSQIAR
jgi:DNA repair exonuclease SbcCD ATPase subunit